MPWHRSFRYYQNQPGLTSLSEIEVEHLVELAKGRREDALWILPLGWNVLLWIAVMGPLIWLTLILQGAGGTGGGSAAGGSASLTGSAAWTVSPLVAKIMISLATCAMVVVSAVVWIWIRRRLIIRSIRFLLNKSACPYCDFDLRGLRVADNAVVVCPECGEIVLLKEHGMTRRDLSLEEAFVPPPPVSPLWHLADDTGVPNRPKPPNRNPAASKDGRGQAANGRSSSTGN